MFKRWLLPRVRRCKNGCQINYYVVAMQLEKHGLEL